MIVDGAYYAGVYLGESVPAAVFPRYSLIAENAILLMCGGVDFDTLDQRKRNAIMTAICNQIDYYVLNGINVATDGLTVNEYSIGKISVKGGKVNGKKSAGMISASAIATLEQTGLLNRSVPSAGSPMYYGGGWIG